jgi:hypothetical protein
MGSHTPTLGDATLRAQPANDRDKRRSRPVASSPQAAIALTPSEAELAGRLSAALEYAPSRQAHEPPRMSQPTISNIINAPPLHDIDDISTLARRAELPTRTDDADQPYTAARQQPPKWLRRSTRKSWPERLSTLTAWLVTTFVVLAITCGMTVAVLGPTRSLTLLTILTDEVNELAASLPAQEPKPAR